MGGGSWGRHPVREVAYGGGKRFEVLSRGHLVGEDRGDVVQLSAELPVFFGEGGELRGHGIELVGDGHDS